MCVLCVELDYDIMNPATGPVVVPGLDSPAPCLREISIKHVGQLPGGRGHLEARAPSRPSLTGSAFLLIIPTIVGCVPASKQSFCLLSTVTCRVHNLDHQLCAGSIISQ